MDQGKEVRPLTKAKDTENALTIKDVLSKAKGAKYRPKADDPKKDPPMPRHSYRSSLLYFFVLFLFLFYFLFFLFLLLLLWQFTTIYNVPSFWSMKRLYFLFHESFFFPVTFTLWLMQLLFCPLMRLRTDKTVNSSGLLPPKLQQTLIVMHYC